MYWVQGSRDREVLGTEREGCTGCKAAETGRVYWLQGSRDRELQVYVLGAGYQRHGVCINWLQGSRDSLNSRYSEAGEEHYGKYPVTGEVLFGLSYNYKQSVLEIDVRQCRELAPVDVKKNSSDPSVDSATLRTLSFNATQNFIF